MVDLTGPANNLSEIIKAAINDEKITPQEREQIMMLADEDGIVDAQEAALLRQLQEMINNGTVKLVAES
ncbi:hypothetical protein MMIC_P2461 [Mariprofundus micogutta]|uniref:Tellurite resistance protein TerB n=1 Tax=Mariprofundus micogutta TaxID=1921010 RepID=A0A1L8CRB6_9PROT|nr:hypothetical protein [Mariprofundus micogutta]GAV21471.1 hypothetical protein MMIC_P2461 [Mariprofundus micogutta]